jgi:hypothetical protein
MSSKTLKRIEKVKNYDVESMAVLYVPVGL